MSRLAHAGAIVSIFAGLLASGMGALACSDTVSDALASGRPDASSAGGDAGEVGASHTGGSAGTSRGGAAGAGLGRRMA